MSVLGIAPAVREVGAAGAIGGRVYDQALVRVSKATILVWSQPAMSRTDTADSRVGQGWGRWQFRQRLPSGQAMAQCTRTVWAARSIAWSMLGLSVTGITSGGICGWH